MGGYRAKADRNIHFVDGKNDEIAGAWQNGALTWSEMAEWMEITFQKPVDGYAPFSCLEPGDPVNPLANHGPAIIMQGNNNQITTGFYIILSPDGKPKLFYRVDLSKLILLDLGAVVNIPINPQNPTTRSSSRASSSNLDPRVGL